MKKVNHMLADLIWSIKAEKSSEPENFLYWGKILIVPSPVIQFLFEAVKFPPAKNNINCALSICEGFSHMLFNLLLEPDEEADHLCHRPELYLTGSKIYRHLS